MSIPPDDSTNGPAVSVIVCTHGPDPILLTRVLDSIRGQDFGGGMEVLVVDNACMPPLALDRDDVRLVRESRLGLTPARRCGIAASRGETLCFFDDDTLPAQDYVRVAFEFLCRHPEVGAVGGKIFPEFLEPPAPHFEEFLPLLAVRDHGEERLISGRGRPLAYPAFAPVGAGMAVRKETLATWLSRDAKLSDRCGQALSSAGDCDLILSILSTGSAVAYLPELELRHVLPPRRLEAGYLSRLNRAIQRDWVRVLALHGVTPWKRIAGWTIGWRAARAWVRRQAWKGAAERIRWQGDVGRFEGQAAIDRPPEARLDPMRAFLRRAGIGKLVYLAWHTPRRFVQQTAEQGAATRLRIVIGRRAMERAVTRLLPGPVPVRDAREVHFLTGRRFWQQSALCFYSLQRFTGRQLRACFHDDGTLPPSACRSLARLFPGCRLRLHDEIDRHLEQVLPAAHFPTLRGLRKNYPQIRKLTDLQTETPGWRLVLDSDMLFFREPTEILSWLESPSIPLGMRDCEESYGYSRSRLEPLAGHPLPDRFNVGVCGLDAGRICWETLEAWAAELLATDGSSYFLEQALVAMLVGPDCLHLPEDLYIVRPSRDQVQEPAGTLHHYVAGSKESYFTSAWRTVRL